MGLSEIHMSDAEHARYIELITAFYLGRKVDNNELDRLHRLNVSRVGRITTTIKEDDSCIKPL